MKRVFFLALASGVFALTSCTDNKVNLIKPIPEEEVQDMISGFRDSNIIMYEKLAANEDKGTLWSEFKLSDLRDLLSQYADDDKIRLVTAVDADNRPTILFQVIPLTDNTKTTKFYSAISSGVCPEPPGCAGEVLPEKKK